ncbi:hypothetical protein NH340_JMT08237 [Sarcoptes scabiei]|nr:hypothetical protein NH340_JMT08237 [Sarcoptes scabiei]
MSKYFHYCFLFLFVLLLYFVTETDGFIFWKAKTTACDICDGIDTYSGRNVMCCFLSSKCCGYNSLDEAEEIRANATAAAG